jgi:glycosyltransferase involved in cell wall biosynthesis
MFSEHPRVFVAPNVVDAADFDIPNTINPARIVFGMISSNQPKKGLRDFFLLASRCQQLGLPAAFLLIGPDNAHVAEAIDSTCPNGPPSNVERRGYIDDPRHAIAEVNVVLSLSWFAESFGRTVAEGFAARRPAIGYVRGAIPELIDDGENGFLVPPEDIDALVHAVSRFCVHPEIIPAFGERGWQRIVTAYQPSNLRAGVARALQAVSVLE